MKGNHPQLRPSQILISCYGFLEHVSPGTLQIPPISSYPRLRTPKSHLNSSCHTWRSCPIPPTGTYSTMPSNFGDREQRDEDPSAHEQRFDQGKAVKRNPHPDFNKAEADRPDWTERPEWHFTKTKQPGWKLGQGANDGGESLQKRHVEIDPYEQGRPAVFNYKLLISGIIPRPIGFISTQSGDGQPWSLKPSTHTTC